MNWNSIYVSIDGKYINPREDLVVDACKVSLIHANGEEEVLCEKKVCETLET